MSEVSSSPLQVTRNVVYRNREAPTGEDTLDLYVPQGSSLKPLFVFIHGGLWVSGDKKSGEAICLHVAKKHGLACASINYRLSHKGDINRPLFPAHLDNVCEALAWLYKHREESESTPFSSHLILSGHSVGAHMSGLLSLQPSRFPLGGFQLIGAFGIDGVYDTLQFCVEKPEWRGMVATALPEKEEDWISPSTCDSDLPVADNGTNADEKKQEKPLWVLVHSLEDPWVEGTQSTTFEGVLTTAGFDASTTFMEKGGNHDASLTRIATNSSEENATSALDELIGTLLKRS